MAATRYHAVGGLPGRATLTPLMESELGVGVTVGPPATVAYPKRTGPSTCSGSCDQSMLLLHWLPHFAPHVVSMFPVGAVFGYHAVSEVERFAYCCVSPM
jgi:hypothetical protein